MWVGVAGNALPVIDDIDSEGIAAGSKGAEARAE